MNKSFTLTLLTILVAGVATAETLPSFEEYNKAQGVKYVSAEDQQYRLNVYTANIASISANNADPNSKHVEGVNQFTCMTKAEFVGTMLGSRVVAAAAAVPVVTAWAPIPIDWTTKPKVVTAVKNQGSCGSCWAFAAVGVLESLRFQSYAVVADFSEQQLVSCSSGYGNSGCNGGWMTNAYNYVRKLGITTEALYTYTSGTNGATGTCKTNGGAFKISGYTNVGATCASLATAVAFRPLAVAVDATNWSPYKSGVFSNCKTNINHGVILVGVNSTAWKIKNSWGTSWGQSGYMLLAATNGNNTCNVCGYGSYPNK